MKFNLFFFKCRIFYCRYIYRQWSLRL